MIFPVDGHCPVVEWQLHFEWAVWMFTLLIVILVTQGVSKFKKKKSVRNFFLPIFDMLTSNAESWMSGWFNLKLYHSWCYCSLMGSVLTYQTWDSVSNRSPEIRTKRNTKNQIFLRRFLSFSRFLAIILRVRKSLNPLSFSDWTLNYSSS